MAIWKDFENECTDYLNKQFGNYATFIHQGGSNSNDEDIKVTTKNKKEFYIEAKHSPAQCGQFVLIPNIETRKFNYSPLNVNKLNDSALKIITHMNEKFDEFKEAGTAGRTIEFVNSEQVFCDWIINAYKTKGVKYFITNNYTIFPIERLGDYFKISAKYRVKRSGSSSVGNNNLRHVETYIKNNFNIQQVEIKQDKIFVKASQALHNTRFVLNGYEFMFSQRDDVYEIRKLSNTFNANVIFSVELKNGINGMTIQEFIRLLIS